MDFTVLSEKTAQALKRNMPEHGMFCEGCEEMPSAERASELLFMLRRVLLPRLYNGSCTLEERVEMAAHALFGECALCYMISDLSKEEAEECAATAVESFFSKLDSIRDMLWCDLLATFEGDPAASGIEEIVLAYPGFFAIMTNRIAHELYTLGVPLLPRMMSEYAHTRTGIDIHPGAVLGKYLCIDHGTGVVIGESTVIGERVKIYQGVTLGALSTRKGQGLRGKKRHPTIEDGVTVYSNASILGGDTVIGHDSVIGGSVFLTTSVPPNSRVRLDKMDYVIE